MQFANPGWFWLMVLVPMPWLLDRWRPRVGWPSFSGFAPRSRPGWVWLRWLPPLLRGLAIAALAVALARPQTVGGKTRIDAKGVAIVVALDHSSSMKAADFPTERGTRMMPRLEAAKATFREFVEGRPNDLVGLITFANLPLMVCPPTPDHAWLVEHAAAIVPARAGDDGTNIGDAIALGIGALVDLSPMIDSSPRRKVLVLLTDGQNQPAGAYFKDPEQAARLARDWSVILHTIAIGQPGGIVRGVDAASQQATMTEAAGPNIELLESLARITGGISRLAVDTDSLAGIFREIDRLEKSEIHGQIVTRYEEHYARWAALALGLLFFDRLLAQGRLRRLP
jgi:Ca-activated chloride channel family protein